MSHDQVSERLTAEKSYPPVAGRNKYQKSPSSLEERLVHACYYKTVYCAELLRRSRRSLLHLVHLLLHLHQFCLGHIVQQFNIEHQDAILGNRPAFGHVRAITKLRRNPERSEEHTSELQSLMRISYAVFCLKKKKCTSVIIT